jgi:hypothetical protein
MAVQGQSNRRHFIASAVVMGLVCQALAAAFMLPMPLGMQSALADTAPNTIIICTPSGMKQISFDASGNPVEKTVPGGKCPVCDALAAVTFAMPAGDGIAPLPVAVADVARPANAFIPSSIACLAHNNRDPPLLV